MSDIILVKLPGIDGECTLKGYDKYVEAMSYSHGVAMSVTNTVTNSERTAGKPMVQDFTFTKQLDLASPVLNQKCCQGTILAEDTLVVVGRNDNGAVLPLITYTLSNVVVSSINVGGGGGIPSETVSLNFTKIKWEYKAQKGSGGQDGTAPGVWDVAKNNAA
ncbi:MAG: type VI secretion system tube protein Hcp [Gemmatimonadales bacterium]|nr:type VI secretion system tube protein Hcp [Gemmatimonadales bacterium]